jgi:hypothetical protein
VIHVFNKARWNIVANEGLLYSFHWTPSCLASALPVVETHLTWSGLVTWLVHSGSCGQALFGVFIGQEYPSRKIIFSLWTEVCNMMQSLLNGLWSLELISIILYNNYMFRGFVAVMLTTYFGDTWSESRSKHRFLEPLETNVEMAPQLGCNCFLPNPVHFIIHP